MLDPPFPAGSCRVMGVGSIFFYYTNESYCDRQRHLSFMVKIISNFIPIQFRHYILPFCTVVFSNLL